MVTLSLTELVAKNVAQAILAAGETPSSVARATGIPRVTLSRRLKGDAFTVAELDKIATVLRTDVIHLIATAA